MRNIRHEQYEGEGCKYLSGKILAAELVKESSGFEVGVEEQCFHFDWKFVSPHVLIKVSL